MEINFLNTAQLNASASSAERAGQITQGTRTREQARKAAEEFEAIFISQMLAPVFSTVPTDGPFGGGPSEGIYRSLQVEQFGNEIAKAGGIGIADNVMREILKAQEGLL